MLGLTMRVARPTRTAAIAALGAIVVLSAGLAMPTTGQAGSLSAALPVRRVVGAPIGMDQFQWFVGLTTDGHYLYAADRGRIVKFETGPTRAIATFDASKLAPYLVTTPRSQYGVGSAVMAAGDHGIFISNGTKITRIGAALDGSGVVTYGTVGSDAGQFRKITGMAVFGDSLYVADSGNSRVVRLPESLDGSSWTAFGSSGTGVGKFGTLAGIAATDLAVFVADAGNDRIVRLWPALDGTGWATVVRKDAAMYGTLQVKGTTLYIRASDCTADLEPGVLRVPTSMTFSGVSCLHIAPTDVSVSARSFATDIAVTPAGMYIGTDAHDSGLIEMRRYWPDSPTVADVYGSAPYAALGQLAAPRGTAVAGDMLYVCDLASGAPLAGARIVALRRSDMSFVAQVGAACSPSRLAATDGWVFASDGETIQRFFGDDLAAAGVYGTDGAGVGGFSRIDAIAATGGTVFAVDGSLGRVARLSAEPFDGTGWKTAKIARFGPGIAFAGADDKTFAYALEAPGGTNVLRTGVSLTGGWVTRKVTKANIPVTDLGGIDVDGGRLFLAVDAFGGKASPSVLVLDAKTLATVGFGPNKRKVPARLTYPTGIAVSGPDLYIADGIAPPGAKAPRTDAGIVIWRFAAAS